MRVEVFSVAPMGANCYIVTDQKSGQAIIIDPGYPDPAALSRAAELGDRVRYILFTHRHFDHVLGAVAFKKATGAPLVIHKMDAEGLCDPEVSLYARFADYYDIEQETVKADLTVDEGDRLSFADGVIEVLHTPGHTSGSVCYRLGELLFTGDTLFRGSMGRVDFPSGSVKQMENSLRRLSGMDGHLAVYSGHGGATDIDTERRTNMYMKRANDETLCDW